MSIAAYQYGEIRPRKVGILTAQAVEQWDLIALSSGNAYNAADQSGPGVWGSAVATPSAPTLANGAVAVGSPLTNALTGVKVSIMFPWGEGALSAAGTATPTAGALIKCTLAALPSPGLYWCIYVEDSAGSGTYKLQSTSHTGAIVMIASYGTGRVPPTAVNSGALEITQYNFAQSFLGLSHQRKAASVARCYGSSEDNILVAHCGGVFLCDCASASFNVGDPVGPAKDTGNALLSQKVVAVADISLGCGYVTEKTTTLTQVKVEIISKKSPPARTPLGLAI